MCTVNSTVLQYAVNIAGLNIYYILYNISKDQIQLQALIPKETKLFTLFFSKSSCTNELKTFLIKKRILRTRSSSITFC